MEKQRLRERVWDELEASDTARFPYPPHGRIPNVEGATAAAERLGETDAWRRADVVKANPDAPQLPVRRAALRAGKVVYMAVPRLAERRCFRRLDPAVIEDTDAAATIGGAAEAGEQVGPAAMEPVDLIVAGSVAVRADGTRVGKGEGYSDLEFAILHETGLVDDDTTVATTVHERQVRTEEVPVGSHDVPLDLIVTPERILRPDATRERPAGIDWAALEAERIAEIPILAERHPG